MLSSGLAERVQVAKVRRHQREPVSTVRSQKVCEGLQRAGTALPARPGQCVAPRPAPRRAERTRPASRSPRRSPEAARRRRHRRFPVPPPNVRPRHPQREATPARLGPSSIRSHTPHAALTEAGRFGSVTMDDEAEIMVLSCAHNALNYRETRSSTRHTEVMCSDTAGQ